VTIYGASDPISGNSIEEILQTQLQYRFFPIRECELNAKIEYVPLKEGESVSIGNALVTPVLMNHPVVNFGYRIDNGGKSLFFTGDHEPSYNIYEPEDDEYAMYQALIEQKDGGILERVCGVDVLVADASYTEDEYPAKKGWGHGTLDTSIQMAEKAKVSQLFLTHHEPTRDDEALEAVFNESLGKRTIQGCEIELAREGVLIEW